MNCRGHTAALQQAPVGFTNQRCHFFHPATPSLGGRIPPPIFSIRETGHAESFIHLVAHLEKPQGYAGTDGRLHILRTGAVCIGHRLQDGLRYAPLVANRRARRPRHDARSYINIGMQSAVDTDTQTWRRPSSRHPLLRA